MSNLVNCSKCGKLFSKSFKNVCPTCSKELDQQWQKCKEYLRKNRACDMYELSDNTDTPINQVMEWIREGRILVRDFPNIKYPCDGCGEPINKGNYCAKCKSELEHGIDESLDSVKQNIQSKANKSERKYNTNLFDR